VEMESMDFRKSSEKESHRVILATVGLASPRPCAGLPDIYMLPFDEKVKSAVETLGGMYRRYCDDILVAVPGEDAGAIYEVIESELAELKLAIQDTKTVESHFESGRSAVPLPYLGLVYDGSEVFLRAFRALNDASWIKAFGLVLASFVITTVVVLLVTWFLLA